MARPRSFDRTQVLEAATQQFWRHGFTATSTDDLCAVTGLGRGSLYNAFSGKSDLFVECLALYLARAAENYRTVLAGNDDALGAMGALFGAVVDDEIHRRGQGAAAGCLAVNTVVELAHGPQDSAVLRQIDADTAQRLESLSDVLRVGQLAGEITATMTSMQQAECVNAAIVGIRVAARRGAERSALDAIAQGTLRALAV